MKLAFAVLCAVFGLSCQCSAIVFGDPGAKEVKGKLQCSIQGIPQSAAAGSRFSIAMSIENVGSYEAELPFPGCGERGMQVRVFVVSGQSTNAVQQLIIPSLVFSEHVTAEQEHGLSVSPAGEWSRTRRVSPQWITIPPHAKETFTIVAEMSPKHYNQGDYGDVLSLPAGSYGLQREIEFTWGSFMSQAFLRTNEWTSAEDIAKAKADGRFLLDMHRLWTGKMDSNIAPITLTGN